MEFKGQSLASAIIADAKSKVTDELEEAIFKAMLSENMESIINGCGE